MSTTNEKLIEIEATPRDLVKRLVQLSNVEQAPTKTEWGEGMKEISVSIGPDNTVDIYLHEEDIEELGL